MEIIWRESALRDLEAIRAYIARDSTEAAKRVRGAIQTVVSRLEEHPESARPGRVEGTRELIVTGLPYVVAYRVADKQVRILAVIHTSRQWPEHFY